MFDIGFTELLVIGVVALIVIGPERLPRVAREREHAPGVPEHEVARARGRGATAEPVKQLDAELVFEGPNVLGDRRLGEKERLGGA